MQLGLSVFGCYARQNLSVHLYSARVKLVITDASLPVYLVARERDETIGHAKLRILR